VVHLTNYIKSYFDLNKMEISQEIRHILLFCFKKGQKCAKTLKKVCAVYGEMALSISTVKRWFSRFRSGNFDIKDESRSGRPITKEIDEILKLIHEDRHISTRHIAKELNIGNATVWRYLRRAGYTKKLDVWVPHQLSIKNMADRLSVCEMLSKRNKDDPFLKRIITGDEKWVRYENIVRKKSWKKKDEPSGTQPKAGLTESKVMLCIWWDWKGVVHYEVLPPGLTMNSVLYCKQLDRLEERIQKTRPELANRKGVVFHHDNARPHTSKMTRQKLLELGYEVLPHPPYSPDLAPSDYYLFLALQNFLNDKKFVSKRGCENALRQFFDQKSRKFYTDGIMQLPTRWQKVAEQNGTYLVQ
jgi:[histone H3]-lysine36 N-dimethyltransferase SETMAR